MGKSSMRILLRTTLIAYILTAILLLLLAFGLYKFHLSESQVSLGVNAIYVITCFIAGIIAGKSAKVRRFLWGFASGAIYYIILLAVSFLINKQLNASTQELALILAMCAGSATLGGMIS